jgi:hypothetical protein
MDSLVEKQGIGTALIEAVRQSTQDELKEDWSKMTSSLVIFVHLRTMFFSWRCDLYL